MKPIYKPSGRAKEYGELALNIYTGCPHRCTYCYAPQVLKRDRETFHSVVEPRKDIVEATKRQIDREQITGKLIHICFSCDPYPTEIDTTPTREIIQAIKAAGNNVQILTKGGVRAERDFDLLDAEDWFGVSIAGHYAMNKNPEPNAAIVKERVQSLERAKKRGIKTWISYEPILNAHVVIKGIAEYDFVDMFKIGKLHYVKHKADWGKVGREIERKCIEYGRNYYIKDDLRKAMGGAT
ncbi:MAG: radical SAM protein [Defluviitaleaceae bacterium]|nr:radical SAM protein [Defluviitaleaceae bacterium]MCL2261653.1 radical SAM protein [Defluviitaleaceae bacterium]